MPIKAENRHRYGPNWRAISQACRERAGHRCEQCGIQNHVPIPGNAKGSKVVLTVAHVDHVIENVGHANLRAWCQRCHLHHDKEIHAENRKKSKVSA
jgi:5-methylcytosine-specific restriction endonuclease McrA